MDHWPHLLCGCVYLSALGVNIKLAESSYNLLIKGDDIGYITPVYSRHSV